MTSEETEFVENWIEALRGGQYKQTKYTLVSVDPENGECSYCCLGVACVLAGKDTSDFEGIDLMSDTIFASELPVFLHFINQWEDILAEMNDKNNKSFAEIADFIEEKLREENAT